MIPMDIDLLSNEFKNHSFWGHFSGVFEQLDSSSFCAFMAAELATNCCHLSGGAPKRTAVIPTNELLSFMAVEPKFRLPGERV
jgi:hypothetical protein